MIFILLKNESALRNKWSKVENVLNLEKVDPALKADLDNDTVLTNLGLSDCIVTLDME